ncbi:MAG: hypothetical protein ABL984_14880 [Pyrinomonadaceae bacterium]
MKKLLTVISVFLIFACDGRSQLPEKMPDDVSISLTRTGGMMRAHRKINVTAGTLEFDELKGSGVPQVKWSKQISAKDVENLYRVFVDNKFDTIRNDTRTETVHDAGSEYISLSLGIGRTFNAVYGKNSPLSGSNLRRYQSVSKAINDLLAKYQRRDGEVSDVELTEAYLHGTWRAAGETPDRHAWFLEWTFKDGRFKQSGYPPILQEGKYRLVESDKKKLTIELFEQDGTFGKESQQTEITIDLRSNLLTISNMKGFSKVSDPIIK